MKISINDKELFTLSDIQKQVICDEINTDIIDIDLRRRIQWVLMHKYENCFSSLKSEWDVKLAANGARSVPTDADEYAAFVFAQPNYKCRKTRDLEATELI